MRMDKMTAKFQQALADAQSLAVGRSHQFIEPLHVMLVLLDQDGGSARHLLAQSNVGDKATIMTYLLSRPNTPIRWRRRPFKTP